MESPTVQPPERVFVSYSHESDDHNELVLSLTGQLRSDGVSAFCDRYANSPDEGWPRWMEQQIGQADFVLIVCTDTYKRRLSQDKSEAAGKGVIWEANLIYQLIYESSTVNSRFIPILLPGAIPSDIPTPLRSVTHYTLTPPFSTKDPGYEDLYRRITNQPRVHVPILGHRQSLLPTPARPQRDLSLDAPKTGLLPVSQEEAQEAPSSAHKDHGSLSQPTAEKVDTSLSLTNLSAIFGLVVNVVSIISFIKGLTTLLEVVAIGGVVWLFSLALAIWLPVSRRVALIVLFTLPLLLGAGFGLRNYLEMCPHNKVCVVLAPFDASGDKTGQFVTNIKNELDIVAKQYPELQVSRSYEIIPNNESEQTFSDARRIGATLVFWGDFETTVPNPGAGTLVYGYHIFTLDSVEDLAKNKQTLVPEIKEDDWRKSFAIQNQVKDRAVYLTKVVLGLAAWNGKNYADAIARLSDALAHVPPGEEPAGRATVYLFRGRSYAQSGMFAEAIQDYKSVIGLDTRRTAAYQAMGTAYFAQNHFDEAISTFGICIARNLHDPLAFDGRGLAYLRRATAAEISRAPASRERDLASADADFAKAIDLDPRFAPAFNHRGLLSLARGQQENALGDFDTAIKIDPKYTEALENRGRVLSQRKRWQESVQAYTLAINSTETGLDIVALAERGAAYSASKEYPSAIADFTKAINCQPTSQQQCDSSKIALYVARGLAYGEMNRYDEAVADFGQAIVRDTNNANLYYNAGVLLKNKGEKHSALLILSKAIELKPTLSQAYYERAALYRNEGETKKAIDDLQTFLAMATDDDSKAGATYELERLKKATDEGR